MTSMSRFEASRHVIQCELAGEAVLLDTREGLYFGLDQIGTKIWSMATSGLTEAEVCDRIEEEYDVQRRHLEMDVRRLLLELTERRLLVPIN